jgi:hypothetical protein
MDPPKAESFFLKQQDSERWAIFTPPIMGLAFGLAK